MQAQAAEARGGVGRWLTANLDFKTVLGVAGLALTLIGFRMDTATRLTRADDDARRLSAGLAQANRRLDRLAQDTIKRTDYEHDSHQLDTRIDTLAAGEQQIFTLLVQGYARPAGR